MNILSGHDEGFRRDDGAQARRILVVEDNSLVASTLAEALQLMGFDVCAVVDTEAAAISAVGRYGPDLIIVDLLLREGSGLGFVAEIASLRPTPHVYISGNRAALMAVPPGTRVLCKPFKLPDLAAAIQQALGTA